MAICQAVFLSPAFAQDAGNAAAEGDDALEELVVMGSPITASQAQSIKQQREADNLIDVVTGDAAGRFPDQNSAAVLARLPAVAVQRDQGQERYIQVRGAPNRWTSVSIDGVTTIGADEGGSQRAFRFDAIPTVMLKGIEVNKSLTPDLSAEAVVARVNLETFSPFDYEGFSLQGDVGYGFMSLGDGDQLQGSARASWSGEKWGIIGAISHYEREQTTDNREFEYDADGTAEKFDIRSYKVDRSNDGAILGLEFRPSEGHRIFAKSIYSLFADNERRNQYVFQIADALSGTIGETEGTLVGVPVQGSFNDGKYRTRNYINTLGGDHAWDTWKLDWRINYTRTENETDLPLVLETQQDNLIKPSITYTRDDPNFPIISLYETVSDGAGFAAGEALDGFDQSAFDFNLMLPLESEVITKSWTYKADLSRELELGGNTWTVTGGAEYADRDIAGSILTGAAPTVLLSALLPVVGQSFNAGDYVTDKPWDTNYPLGFAFNYIDDQRMNEDLQKGLDALEEAGLYDPSDYQVPTDQYTINEKVLAGYGKMEGDMGDVHLVAGLRVERASLDVGGFIDNDTSVVPVSYEQDYTDFFPSLNVKYEFAPEWIIRGAIQRGISRPSFGTIRAGASIDDIDGTITGGNPTLQPERTWGGDLRLERYLSGAGLMSVGGFYRHVSNVLFNSTAEVDNDFYDTDGFDRTGYDYVTTLNGGDGNLYGLELEYVQRWIFLPEPFHGLGFQGNLSFLDGKFETPDGRKAPFPGTSDVIANASLFYEAYGVSARLSYQWRDDWVDTLSFEGFGDQSRKAYGNLDFSFRYAINYRFTVFLDANNLTNEKYIAYEGDVSHPTEVEQIGRRYLAGIRFSY